jgi:hypothetical protein
VRAADVRRALDGLAAATRTAVRQARGHDAPWEPGFDHHPRRCPAGMSGGPPDFVGIGAQKAGTSWWYDLVCSHPGVYCHPDFHKERHFLSALGAGYDLGIDRLADYEGWFPRPPGTVTGEWTPDYLYFHWVPELLSRVAPSAKLLVLLRDPIERFRSGLTHQSVNGSGGSAAGAEEAFARGLYASQLARWAGYFPREQFLVLQYERCRQDPAGQLAATYAFLGLDDGFVPPGADEPPPPPVVQRPVLSEERRALLVGLYQDDVIALVRSYPEVDLGLWPDFAGHAPAASEGGHRRERANT